MYLPLHQIITAFPELWDWGTLTFLEVLSESFQPEELCSMNFDFQKKFYKHLKKCALCLLQNSKSNTIWWGKPYNFNFPRFWAKNQSLLKFTIGL